jgi:hypothetical protein
MLTSPSVPKSVQGRPSTASSATMRRSVVAMNRRSPQGEPAGAGVAGDQRARPRQLKRSPGLSSTEICGS